MQGCRDGHGKFTLPSESQPPACALRVAQGAPACNACAWGTRASPMCTL